MNDETQAERTAWHLDRRIPIATLLALLVQSTAVVWWASQLSFQSADHEKRIDRIETIGTPSTVSRVAVIETKLQHVDDQLDRVERKIDALGRQN